jgi:hypothetical protein
VNRKRIKIALIPILAIALIVVLRGEPSETETAASRPRRPEFPAATAESGGRIGMLRPRSAAEVSTFDPFAPPERSQVEMPSADVVAGGRPSEAMPTTPLRHRLRIDAIIKQEGDYRAMIGGKLIQAGDLIDDGRYRVTSITAHDVTFSRLRP